MEICNEHIFEYQQNDKFGFVWEREILPTFDDNFNGESDSTIKQCLGVAFFPVEPILWALSCTPDTKGLCFHNPGVLVSTIVGYPLVI